MTFLLQTGASWERFITETTRLIDNWNNKYWNNAPYWQLEQQISN